LDSFGEGVGGNMIINKNEFSEKHEDAGKRQQIFGSIKAKINLFP
jgi:hypothetical protein